MASRFFLSKLFAAADDVSAFRILESEYGFTVALLDLADAKTGTITYAGSLDSSWVLVYIDDAVAAYVKDVPAHADVIARLRYRILTPENFTSGKVLGGITDFAPVITELTRAAAQAPGSFQARLLLGRALVAQGNLTDASSAAAEAVTLRPDDYRGYELFGLMYARAGEYGKAETAFNEAISRLSSKEAGPLKEYVARIFEGVGEEQRAKRYQ
jgi:tetratricopeptide (TPR) repeat protein